MADKHGHAVLLRKQLSDLRPSAVVAPEAVTKADHQGRLGHQGPSPETPDILHTLLEHSTPGARPAAPLVEIGGKWRRRRAQPCPAVERSALAPRRFQKLPEHFKTVPSRLRKSSENNPFAFDSANFPKETATDQRLPTGAPAEGAKIFFLTPRGALQGQ
jgi:hypothetical protein